MKLGIKGKLQKRMQDALVEQAYLSYKYGWHQAQVREEAKLSKRAFCNKIKIVIEEGKHIADGFDTGELFPKGMDGFVDGEND